MKKYYGKTALEITYVSELGPEEYRRVLIMKKDFDYFHEALDTMSELIPSNYSFDEGYEPEQWPNVIGNIEPENIFVQYVSRIDGNHVVFAVLNPILEKEEVSHD